jgi:diguanylate cyclase (GGDEF)-like protein
MAAWAALAAAAVASLGLLVGVGLLRAIGRGRPAGEERLAGLIAELDRRLEEMGQDLQAALARAREESRRSRVLGELASSIDLDEVLRRALDTAAALPGVDAALLSVATPQGETVTRSSGLSQAELEEVQPGPPPPAQRLRLITLAYEGGGQAGGPPIRHGLAAPIRRDGDTAGLLCVFSRHPEPAFSEQLAADLADLAARVAPALENALRFQEARHLAEIDTHTGLHNRRYFHETLAREVARAHRYQRPLALLIFDLDDFKAVNDRLGHLAGDAVLAQVGERVRNVVRSADIPCRVGGDEFAVILPESTLEDAEQLHGRLRDHLAARPIAEAGRLTISAGIAELRPQDDAVSFFERADDALYRAKRAGKGRVALATAAIGRPEDAGATAISAIERDGG